MRAVNPNTGNELGDEAWNACDEHAAEVVENLTTSLEWDGIRVVHGWGPGVKYEKTTPYRDLRELLVHCDVPFGDLAKIREELAHILHEIDEELVERMRK